MLRLMPEIVSAAIRPTRLFPKQIRALAIDLVQASFGPLGRRADPRMGQLAAAADVHLGN